jgi:hypothetical protein
MAPSRARTLSRGKQRRLPCINPAGEHASESSQSNGKIRGGDSILHSRRSRDTLSSDGLLGPYLRNERGHPHAGTASFSILNLETDAGPQKSRPTRLGPAESASNCVQNRAFYGPIWGVEASKANCINRSYGAGDGNRTHVRSLGKLYCLFRTYVAKSVSRCQPLKPKWQTCSVVLDWPAQKPQ